MSPLEEIKQAFRAIEAAERRYRDVLRQHLAAGTVQQVEVVRELNRTREMVRRDAMTEEQRNQLRRADAERRRAARANTTAGKPAGSS